MTTARHLARAVAGGTGLLALLLGAAAASGLTYNATASLPVGIYRIEPLEGAPRRGEVVGVCLEREAAQVALARAYVHRRGLERWVQRTGCGSAAAVIGKPVAGVPGDTVRIGPDGVSINGRLLLHGTTPRLDGRGRRLRPYGRTLVVLGEDEYWIQSPHSARSFDSRIFGPVRRDRIRDRRVPVWVRAAAAERELHHR